MTTILTFIIPALIVVLLSLPLVNVFKGKVTAKSAKMRLGTHICGFFGAVALVLFLTYANSPVLAAGADKMTGSIAQGLGFIGAALATGLSALGAGIENEKNFGKSLIFVALGEGVAIYGLLISILIINTL